MLQRSICAGLMALAVLVTGCGGGGGGDTATSPPVPPAEAALPGLALVKLRAQGDTQWVALAERVRALQELSTPDRVLLLSRPAPAQPLAVAAPAGWAMVDMDVHPSGQLSVVLAQADALRLLRLAADGQVLADQAFDDPGWRDDPFLGDADLVRGALLMPRVTLDAVRLAAQGEQAVLALRSGRAAVVAHGLRWQGGAYARSWRTLVEPGVYIGARRTTSGSFDPFGSLDNPWQLRLDVADDGRVALAVGLGHTELAQGHQQHFGEPTAGAGEDGALLTRLAADGRRLGTTLVATGMRNELHGLRWQGTGLVLIGRVRPGIRADGGSWDGWLAWVDAASGALQQQQTLDVDRSDQLFDAIRLADGRWLLAGSTGYWQNPTGASISEEAQPLLALLPAPGQAVQRLALQAAPRHNQARALLAQAGGAWVAGMANGPGTHSADADPALLVADGFARRVVLP